MSRKRSLPPREPRWKATIAGRPISCNGSITQIRFGCNIHQLSQVVNVLLIAKHCRNRRPISLTIRSLPPSRPKVGRIELIDPSDKFCRID